MEWCCVLRRGECSTRKGDRRCWGGLAGEGAEGYEEGICWNADT